ncbi:C39 family peptidase [Massilia sp. MB5]|uniref:C39 family peptidase n=1 Tax=unclassified Massilia TaxID=2609279 RepID=UPI00067B9757|nr:MULTISPECIES: C39 family peptidase [unclassified Massilia]AKU24870.1 peptidase C39 family protein [Massilia sp. NR 4-1]UMR33029.1 C39 family peptidase [Massilia sp. MB5]
MLMLLMGVLAVLIGGAGALERHEVKDRPQGQFEMPQNLLGGGSYNQAVTMEPFSELKYRHIVRQAYDYSCGSAALVTILRFHLGLQVTEQQAMEGMLDKGEKDKIIERRGFSLLDMKRYAASLKVQGAGFRAEVKDLLTLTEPAIVPIDYAGAKHFVVLRGIRDGVVFIADPSAGNLAFSVEEFARLWDKNTLFILSAAPGSKVPAQLALNDQELGVVDMDRITNRGQLGQINNAAHLLERAVNSGAAGTWTRRQ